MSFLGIEYCKCKSLPLYFKVEDSFLSLQTAVSVSGDDDLSGGKVGPHTVSCGGRGSVASIEFSSFRLGEV